MNRWDGGSGEGGAEGSLKPNDSCPFPRKKTWKEVLIEARSASIRASFRKGMMIFSRGFLLIMLMLLTVDVAAGGVNVRDVTLWENEKSYLLDADIDYFPTDKVIEALKNGIHLTFEVTVKVRESDSWLGWFKRALTKRKIRFQLRYRPLSSLYEISRDDNQMQRNFVSWKSLFSNLGELRQIAIVESGKLDVHKKYRVEVKAELDINSLPLPMRPMAYIDSDWDMSSGWSEWPLHQ